MRRSFFISHAAATATFIALMAIHMPLHAADKGSEAVESVSDAPAPEAAPAYRCGRDTMQTVSHKPTKRAVRPDLADTVIGTYFGGVISDSRGSSQPGVTLYVTKVNKSTVRVASDYARLPTVEVPIAVYSNQVLQVRGASVFVLNRNKSPQTLDFNPDGSVSFSGTRQSLL